ncbi:origin recognition complex subunit 3 N-terminus-domain-containing protein [Phlyctochytrium arcticum]|nr:origin recognition complex subunit 3 N-terminus-domain-containing protein [Phlyctochytrium arcticum]
MPDHELLFSQVTEKVKSETQHRIALLPSRECPNLKSTIKNMIQQFVGSSRGITEEEGILEPMLPASSLQTNVKLPAYDMQILTGWYGYNPSCKNLVAIIPDYECFDSGVLQDLIDIFREYHGRLPLVLLFGVATSTNALDQTLPRSALSALRVENFQLQNSNHTINTIVEELLVQPTFTTANISKNGFPLGSATFDLLVSNYQLHTMSVGSFVQTLKYAVMDYYYSNPLSILFDLHLQGQLMQQHDAFSAEHLISIRLLKSFQRHVESLVEDEPEEAARLLQDDKAIPPWCNKSFIDLQEYRVRYHIAMSCLIEIQTAAKNPSFNRPLRSLHNSALRGDFPDETFIEPLLRLVRKKPILAVQQLLTTCMDKMRPHTACAADLEKLEALMKQSEEWADSDSESESDDNCRADPDSPFVVVKSEASRKRLLASGAMGLTPGKKGGRTTNVSKRLKPIVENIKKGTAEAFLKDVADAFWQYFESAFRSYTTLPLHELVYHSNPMRLQLAFRPQPRASIQTALGQTQHYFHCDCCVASSTTAFDNVNSIHHSLQDASIAYRLYLECGRMINLYDWFVAFGAVVEKEEVVARDAPSLDEEQMRVTRAQEIQARFVRAMGELQFLGFIKPTTRKTDHVMRLTWGGV